MKNYSNTIEVETATHFLMLDIFIVNDLFSIRATVDRVLTEDQAKKEALSFWESYFDDSPAEIISMNRKIGSKCYDSQTAAQTVVTIDGELHGLDISRQEGNKVYISESTSRNNIDEVAPFLPWFVKFGPILETLLDKKQRTTILKAISDFKRKDFKRKNPTAIIPQVTLLQETP